MNPEELLEENVQQIEEELMEMIEENDDRIINKEQNTENDKIIDNLVKSI